MPNLGARIAGHNKYLLSRNATPSSTCNCQKNRLCPLNGNCVVENVIYKAEVVKSGQQIGDGNFYVGLASGLFKKRLANHINSFKDGSKRAFCELSNFIWTLKDKGVQDFNISWEIIASEPCYNRANGKCQLCLREKLEILKLSKAVGNRTINRRTELGKSCIHRYKHMLGYLPSQRILSQHTERNNIEQHSNSISERSSQHNENIHGDKDTDHNFYQDRETSIHTNVSLNNLQTTVRWGSTRSGKIWRNEFG